MINLPLIIKEKDIYGRKETIAIFGKKKEDENLDKPLLKSN